MCELAYNIDTAAAHSNTTPARIAIAIRDGDLAAYRIDGQAMMLPDDIRAWVKSHPKF